MNQKELNNLVEKAIDGSQQAFELLVEQKAKQIFYVSVKLLKNKQDGEDAAQEAMIRMYQHIGELKSPEAFSTWMYQIITRTCINYSKKKGKEEYDYLDLDENELNEMRRDFLPQEYIEDVDKREFLMKVIDALPENYRLCLLMFYYEDMSYQQIAGIMGVSEKSVDNVLTRAKKRIRQQLERRYGEQVSLSTFQGAAALPVLSQVFQMDATSLAAPEILARIVSGAEAGIVSVSSGAFQAAGAAQSASTANTAAATASGAATAPVSTSAKILIGLVAAGTAVGGAAYVLPESAGAMLAGSHAIQEAMAILTVEDMIGEENAETLRAYCAGDEDPARWQGFLTAIDVSALRTTDDGEFIYTLYHLERQDKQLLILQKSLNAEIENDSLEVVFHFTDSHEEAPRELGLLETMGRWRQ